jgi:hypothetical protein
MGWERVRGFRSAVGATLGGGNEPHGSYFGTSCGCELSLQALTRPRGSPSRAAQLAAPTASADTSRPPDPPRKCIQAFPIPPTSPHPVRSLPRPRCVSVPLPALHCFSSPSSPQPIHRRHKLAQPSGTARLPRDGRNFPAALIQVQQVVGKRSNAGAASAAEVPRHIRRTRQ